MLAVILAAPGLRWAAVQWRAAQEHRALIAEIDARLVGPWDLEPDCNWGHDPIWDDVLGMTSLDERRTLARLILQDIDDHSAMPNAP
jgi:hypothetical protein